MARVNAGEFNRVATEVQCPYCFAWLEFVEALRTRKCVGCGRRLPKSKRLNIKHVYVPRFDSM